MESRREARRLALAGTLALSGGVEDPVPAASGVTSGPGRARPAGGHGAAPR